MNTEFPEVESEQKRKRGRPPGTKSAIPNRRLYVPLTIIETVKLQVAGEIQRIKQERADKRQKRQQEKFSDSEDTIFDKLP